MDPFGNLYLVFKGHRYVGGIESAMWEIHTSLGSAQSFLRKYFRSAFFMREIVQKIDSYHRSLDPHSASNRACSLLEICHFFFNV